jgi:hypothetical protein
MVDDYGEYKKMFAADALFAVTELGCWAHARRKFFDLQVSGAHPQAAEALRRIGMLYAVEEASRDNEYGCPCAASSAKQLPVLADTDELVFVPFQ